MKIVTLDLETVTHGKVEDGKFPPITQHRPVVICWMTANISSTADPVFELHCRSGEPERQWEQQALEDLARDCEQAHRLVTFNGRGFDMPLLTLRAVYWELSWRWWIGDRRRRYPDFKTGTVYHWDLIEQLGDYGSARFSLDSLCQMLGLKGKCDIDGSQVGDLWKTEEGRPRVRLYCQGDVIQTWLAYLMTARSFEQPSAAPLFTRLLAQTDDWLEHDHPELFNLYRRA